MSADLRVVAVHGRVACVSDKPIDEVIAYAVRFADGSWANLLSRSYTGSGRGRVFFVTAPRVTETAAAKRVDDVGHVYKLVLTGGCADVVVEQADGDGAVELHGDASFTDAVQLAVHGGWVRATWHACAAAPDDRPRVVRCVVTRGCRVEIEAHGGGHIWIDRARGLTVALGGDSSLVCQHADGLDIDANGSGQAFVANARGDARLRANASGSLIIAGGAIDSLDAAVRSTGSVIVDAGVREAVLSNTGCGTLIVPDVERRTGERHAGPGPLVAGTGSG